MAQLYFDLTLPLRKFIMSMMFLTRLPVPFSRTTDRLRLADSMSLFGLAGAVIGAICGGVMVLFLLIGMPPAIAALLACGAGLLMTGALHEDGLADVADGFGGGKNMQERLAIMRDSRIGSYGTLALLILLGLRVLCYAELLLLPALPVIVVLAAAGAFSRAMMVDVMWSTRPARLDGLSHLAGRPDRSTTFAAIISALIIAVLAGYLIRPDAAVLAVAAATIVTAAIRFQAIRLIDGQTGDVCGAVQVAGEVAMLAVFAAFVR
jgi:adenosylcobinamide-GDP ribazoletransferase